MAVALAFTPSACACVYQVDVGCIDLLNGQDGEDARLFCLLLMDLAMDAVERAGLGVLRVVVHGTDPMIPLVAMLCNGTNTTCISAGRGQTQRDGKNDSRLTTLHPTTIDVRAHDRPNRRLDALRDRTLFELIKLQRNSALATLRSRSAKIKWTDIQADNGLEKQIGRGYTSDGAKGPWDQ